jgi:hypothetical protein
LRLIQTETCFLLNVLVSLFDSQRTCAIVISLAWQMVGIEGSFRQYMVTDQCLPEAERNRIAVLQTQVKTFFGHLALKECRKQYETGRKLKRVLLWKSQEQLQRELKIKKHRKRKQDKRMARLQTLHWLIEQQFVEGGVSLKSQFNSASANNTNLIRLCVALNNIFIRKKAEEKFSMAEFLKHLENKLKAINTSSPTYQTAETLLRKMQTETSNIIQRATEYASQINGATGITKDGWDISEDFDPDVV